MTLQRKIFVLLLAVTLALAGALFAYRLMDMKKVALQKQYNAFVMARQDLQELARSVANYEVARARLGQGGGIARHERVSLETSFSPGELPRLQDLLNRAYEGDGFLLLHHFDLSWADRTSEQGSEGPATSARPGQQLTLSLNGEKIFTH
jgi:hypothetical protein